MPGKVPTVNNGGVDKHRYKWGKISHDHIRYNQIRVIIAYEHQ